MRRSPSGSGISIGIEPSQRAARASGRRRAPPAGDPDRDPGALNRPRREAARPEGGEALETLVEEFGAPARIHLLAEGPELAVAVAADEILQDDGAAVEDVIGHPLRVAHLLEGWRQVGRGVVAIARRECGDTPQQQPHHHEEADADQHRYHGTSEGGSKLRAAHHQQCARPPPECHVA
ncbi:MAG: hypothetical protein ABMA25_24610 [Ilumatobacteraceae bacterium]